MEPVLTLELLKLLGISTMRLKIISASSLQNGGNYLGLWWRGMIIFILF
jgi:hypothetical protein